MLPAYATPFAYDAGLLVRVETWSGWFLAVVGWLGAFELMFGWYANPILLLCLMRLALSRPFSRDGAQKWLIALVVSAAFAAPSVWPGEINMLEEDGFLAETTTLVGVYVWLISFVPPLVPLAIAALVCPWSESAEYKAALDHWRGRQAERRRTRVWDDWPLRS